MYNFTDCLLQALTLCNASHALNNCLLQVVMLCNACLALTNCLLQVMALCNAHHALLAQCWMVVCVWSVWGRSTMTPQRNSASHVIQAAVHAADLDHSAA